MGRRKSKYARPGKRNTTEAFRTEVDFEQVLYRLALHAQSLFTAAVCLGRAQVVLPGGDSAADMASATLLNSSTRSTPPSLGLRPKDHPLPLGSWHICARCSDVTSSIWVRRFVLPPNIPSNPFHEGALISGLPASLSLRPAKLLASL